mmetsp:Transcript_31066/g.53255  ORF Transcript_31066/g.53255 Transcript_31066/m.53255 type:complete len:310 (-) Transcript_31066:242-1171(-)
MDRSQETIAVPAGQMGQPLQPQEQIFHPVGVRAADPNKPEEALRDDFIYLLCCAFTCCNCDFPKCFGTRSECTCLWCENSSICCKVVDDQKACCIFYSGHNETVIPRTLYSEYSQVCCWECYAAVPCVDGPFKKIHDRQNYVTENFTLASDVVVCTGCICCMSGYNCNFPSCLGSYNKSVHCCCESESIFTKPICCDPGYKNPDTCCINYKGHQACVMPYTCCKTISQCCCTDTRYALPCDEEVPAILALCACTMCVDWKCNVSCCKDLNTLMGRKIVTYVDNSAAQNPAMQQQQNPAYNGGTVQAKPI